MKKLISIASFIVLSSFANAHCPIWIEKEQLCADIFWWDGPYDGEESKMEVTFHRKNDHKGVDPSSAIVVYPWMTMNNGKEHGASPVVMKRKKAGVYDVKEIYMMSMPGFWEIRFKYADDPTNTVLAVERINL